MFLVDGTHEGSSRWQDLINVNEDSLLGSQTDALANYIDKLSDSEIGGHKVFLLVNSGNITLLDLFTNDLRYG